MSRQTSEETGEKLCRICLKDDKFQISLISVYARKANIHLRIQKYLQIKIVLHDELPSHICYQCLSNLEFVENFINKAHESQCTINQSEKNSDNTFFDDPSLQTPPNIDIQMQINPSIKSINRGLSLSSTEVESDSEKLFKPKTFNKFKRTAGSFNNDSLIKPDFKKSKFSPQTDLNNTNKIEIMRNKTCHDSDDSITKQNSLQKKTSMIKTYTNKFKMLRNTSE